MWKQKEVSSDHVLERDENGMGSYIREYVNANGESVVQHGWVEKFSDGLAVAYDNGYWGYVNTEDDLMDKNLFIKLNCLKRNVQNTRIKNF